MTRKDLLSQIFRKAHSFKKSKSISFGEALRQAWVIAKLYRGVLEMEYKQRMAKAAAPVKPAAPSRAELERRYDNLQNEGGSGYNPYRSGDRPTYWKGYR